MLSQSMHLRTSEMVHFQSFADKQILAESLAKDVAGLLRLGIAERGKASLVVSGGSTPKPFFEALRKQDVAWEKVYVTLADERWVDNQHQDSNEKLVRENLITSGMQFVPLKTNFATPHEGAEEAAKGIAAMPRPFDAVILGMGDDGHTASFFPYAPELEDALYPMHDNALCVGLTPPEYAPHKRITLTLPALLNARRIILHITGGNKQKIYETASGEGAVAEMPVRAVLRQEQSPVEVYWAA